VAGRLAGKTAIVVGAGQTPGETIGNGKASSLLLAREGATVLCVDRDLDRAEETATEIGKEGGNAIAYRADITDPEQAAALVEDGQRLLGRVDILLNNAGIGGNGDAPAHRASEEAWDRIYAVNIKGMWLTIRAAVPVMRAQGGGSIVNISSIASFMGGNMIAYETTKAAVNRLTTSVAAANARHNVRCNAVAPGLMDTPMAVSGVAAVAGKSTAEVRAGRDARVPRGRMGTAWDTAYAVLFLASDEAEFITGAVLPVDGGMSVRVG
jgi:NAD(P)-dependent dehydrogenase (short-subunit alcohol dehydrogenase family)